MKTHPRTLALLILAALAIALFPGCAGHSLPKWKASVTGSYNGAQYGVTYDGRTVATEVSLGDSLFGWSK